MESVIKRRTLFALLATAVVCLMFLAWWAGGRRAVLLDGTFESGPEQSEFFPDGDCSKKPFWFHFPDNYDMNARIKALEFPPAVRVKLIGNLSRLGNYGHLDAYPREVWPIKIISVDPAPPCWPGSSKPDFYDEVSETLIGQRIIIRGKFSLWGKIGPYVALDEQQQVYLMHGGSFTWEKHYSEMEGKCVAATGILRFYRAPPAKPTEQHVAHAPDYFYLEVEGTRLRLMNQ